MFCYAKQDKKNFSLSALPYAYVLRSLRSLRNNASTFAIHLTHRKSEPCATLFQLALPKIHRKKQGSQKLFNRAFQAQKLFDFPPCFFLAGNVSWTPQKGKNSAFRLSVFGKTEREKSKPQRSKINGRYSNGRIERSVFTLFGKRIWRHR
uniref:hypothetical protein n=2 Tax=Listeria TaxID=1637 RepID=UPI00030602F0|nr:hypothetical protein [Listeria grayi]